MRLQGLMAPLLNSEAFQKVKSFMESGNYPVMINGLSDSGKSYFINGIYEESDKPIVVVTHNDIEARNIYEDLSFYLPNVYYLPSREIVFYNIDAISGDLRWARLKVIKEMLRSTKKIIVTSIDAFAATYTPKELYKSHILKIKVGDEVDFKEISHKLIESGYERLETVEGKGEFSLRGGILDVFPPNSANPFRIELFGDEVDSIRTFNVESQRSIEKVKRAEIFPAKEVILSKETIEHAIEKMRKELSDFENKVSDKEIKERLRKLIERNIESLQENWSFETIDSYLPFFFDKPATLFDYLNNYTFIIDDAKRCKGKLESTVFEFTENYEAFLERGSILPSQINLSLSAEVVEESFKGNKVINLAPFGDGGFIESFNKVEVKQSTKSGYQGQLDMLIDDIKENKKNGFRTLILSGTRPRGERLVNTLRELEIESVYKDEVDEINNGEVVITFGEQNKGFEYPDIKLCLISDKSVFGEGKRAKKTKRKKSKGVSKIKSFAELKPGDYVVHVNSGIGVY
ncbi:MAG: transcription-repair coupling factor, partial [Clostridium perfringens]